MWLGAGTVHALECGSVQELYTHYNVAQYRNCTRTRMWLGAGTVHALECGSMQEMYMH